MTVEAIKRREQIGGIIRRVSDEAFAEPRPDYDATIICAVIARSVPDCTCEELQVAAADFIEQLKQQQNLAEKLRTWEIPGHPLGGKAPLFG